MFDAVLFDLDGTLTDSGEGIIKSAWYALEHFGIPLPSWEEMRVFVGPPLWDTFEKFGIAKEDTDEAVRIFRSRYVPIGKYENTPYPGIAELLQNLKNLNIKLYVATSKPEVTAVDILGHFDLAKFFDGIYGADLEKNRTSKEAVIEYLLADVLPAGKTLMVGDTEFDIIGAKYHGIPAVGVAWGYGKVEDMEQAGAAAIVDSAQSLFEYIVHN